MSRIKEIAKSYDTESIRTALMIHETPEKELKNKKKCIICGKNLKGNQKKYCSKKSCHNKGLQKSMKKYYNNHKKEFLLRLRNWEKTKKKHNIEYNGLGKIRVRNKLVEYVNLYNIKKILTLESDKFFFSKLLPSKKIYVFECNTHTYKKMVKNKPKNVHLFMGDIAEFQNLDEEVNFIYLDFCNTINPNKETIAALKEKIKTCKLFAVTFCLRNYRPEEGHYSFRLINEIQNLTELNLKVIYGESYSDSFPMVTILFENMEGLE